LFLALLAVFNVKVSKLEKYTYTVY